MVLELVKEHPVPQCQEDMECVRHFAFSVNNQQNILSLNIPHKDSKVSTIASPIDHILLTKALDMEFQHLQTCSETCPSTTNPIIQDTVISEKSVHATLQFTNNRLCLDVIGGVGNAVADKVNTSMRGC